MAGLVALASVSGSGALVQTHAQQTAPEPPPAAADQPTFRTDASFVLTDVFVSKDGVPVTDLTIQDFEVKEDGQLQTIRSFEHVRIAPGLTSGRRDPSTVAESRAAASDPRRRVFVLFLDTFHVTRASSMAIRQTLSNFAVKVLGPDDLLALVTPQMGGSDIAFTLRPDAIRNYFEANPVWGVADELLGAETDPVEKNLSSCVGSDWGTLRSRLREKRTFQAMRDTVRYLDGLREARKAIIVVSEGWNLVRPKQTLLTDSDNPTQPPGRPVIGVGPDGRLGNQNRHQSGGAGQYDCDTLRLELSSLDTSEQFRTEIIGEANRANASYYTIDAARLRGGVQDVILPPDPLAGTAQMRSGDREFLSTPLRTLQTLGPATNGLAITDTNDLSRGLQRVVDDFNSFYLLGYNSTNAKLDGRYRKISVRVKRPGVEVRAREGYRAGSAGEPRGRPTATSSAASSEEALVTSALGRIAPPRAGSFGLYAAAGAGAAADGAAGRPLVRIVAELDAALVQTPDWREGGQAQVTIKSAAGAAVGTADVRFAPGERVVRIEVPLTGEGLSGDLRVQVRLTGAGALARFTDATTVRLDEQARQWGAPVVLRRGPTTGTAYVATADLHFRRQERVRVELLSTTGPVSAALVDRKGKPLGVPVRVDPPTAERPLTAEVSLAPLASGDYAIVLTHGDARLAVPIRIIP